MAGIVREGFIEPGLTVIMDDDIFNWVTKAYEEYLMRSPDASGFYINRTEGEVATGKKKELYDRTLRYLEERIGRRIDRVIVVPTNADIKVLRHEIVHDVIEISSQRQSDTFMRLANLMCDYSQRDVTFALAYTSRLSRGARSAKDQAGLRANVLKEFVAYFFTGEASERPSRTRLDEEYREDFVYVHNNMPDEAKALFYELGLIWPSLGSVGEEGGGAPRVPFPNPNTRERFYQAGMTPNELVNKVAKEFEKTLGTSLEQIRGILSGLSAEKPISESTKTKLQTMIAIMSSVWPKVDAVFSSLAEEAATMEEENKQVAMVLRGTNTEYAHYLRNLFHGFMQTLPDCLEKDEIADWVIPALQKSMHQSLAAIKNATTLTEVRLNKYGGILYIPGVIKEVDDEKERNYPLVVTNFDKNMDSDHLSPPQPPAAEPGTDSSKKTRLPNSNDWPQLDLTGDKGVNDEITRNLINAQQEADKAARAAAAATSLFYPV